MDLYIPIANEIKASRTKNNQYFFKGFQPSSPEEYFAIIPKATIANDESIIKKPLSMTPNFI
ncbi:hypothetical protein ACFOET_06870 [Parapedobacter deserti]|uniref:Uncharacterized protein n=1 Tax=Parapedobacter deserti TaxID=1912957 RepID=A0ABV7JGW3_9SPHI